MSEPAMQITRKHVEFVRNNAHLMTLDNLAEFIGCSRKTVCRRLNDHEELSQAWQEAKIEKLVAVAGTLYNRALEGDVACMIFYLKTQGKWRDNQEIEVRVDESRLGNMSNLYNDLERQNDGNKGNIDPV